MFSGVRITRSFVVYVCLVDRCLSFCTFLAILLLVPLRYTDSDYTFGIFKIIFGSFSNPTCFVVGSCFIDVMCIFTLTCTGVPMRFPNHMMFVPFSNSTTSVAGKTGTAYLPGSPEFA